ncbi:MAG: recombinase family protein [Firmicutes bacterium]|nr:recombinase family protein [Bacillota bacterium]
MTDYTVAIYLRLSVDDARSESISIESQRLLLTEYAEKMPVQNVKIVEYTDNGYTGTNFERPAVQRLLSDIQLNKINCILVKDFSRFGRNSIEVGYFTQQVFPLFNVRFISVSDCFDSDEHKGDTGGMNIAFKYLINEYYSRDISIKVKTARQIRIRNGEYCTGQYPYGYKFDENKKLIIDDEVADNIRTIFKLYTEGMPKTQIAKHLSDKGIPTPIQYKAQKGLSSCDISKCKYWKSETIANILSNEIYMGMYVMGKRQVTDVGSKRRILKTEDKWVKIPNHHPAIVSEEIFRKASETKPVYKRKGENARIYPLRSKVFCGCCNHSMEYIKAKNSRFKCKYTRLYGNEPCYQLSITEEALHKQIFDIALVEKVYVYPDKSIKVEWKIQDFEG